MTINKLETCENPSVCIVSDLPDNKIIIGVDNITDTLFVVLSCNRTNRGNVYYWQPIGRLDKTGMPELCLDKKQMSFKVALDYFNGGIYMLDNWSDLAKLQQIENYHQ